MLRVYLFQFVLYTTNDHMTDSLYEDFPTQSDDIHEIASKIGNDLLAGQQYAGLSVADFIREGVIPNAQKFPEYVIGKLALDGSLQVEAFERLTLDIPPPVDTSEVMISQQTKLPHEVEMQIRKSVLLGEHPDFTFLRDQSGIGDLAYKIIILSDLLENEDGKSFHPQNLNGNLSLLEKIMASDPRGLTIDGVTHFALRIPLEFENEFTVSFKNMMKTPIGDYLVVTSPDNNSQLATEFFQNEALVQYYLAVKIEKIQKEKMQELQQSFRSLSLSKYKDVQQELVKTNLPVQRHFFDLLIHDSQQGMTLMSIFRDAYDVSVYQGETESEKGRLQSDSTVNSFAIKSDGENTLTFTWKESVGLQRTNETTIESYTEQVTQQVDVRFNKEANQFEFREHIDGQVTEWSNDNYKYSGTAYPIKNLFEGITAVSLADRLKVGSIIYDDIAPLIARLTHTTTASEFCTVLKEFELSGYPAIEYIVNTNPTINIVVDAFSPKLPPYDMRKN